MEVMEGSKGIGGCLTTTVVTIGGDHEANIKQQKLPNKIIPASASAISTTNVSPSATSTANVSPSSTSTANVSPSATSTTNVSPSAMSPGSDSGTDCASVINISDYFDNTDTIKSSTSDDSGVSVSQSIQKQNCVTSVNSVTDKMSPITVNTNPCHMTREAGGPVSVNCSPLSSPVVSVNSSVASSPMMSPVPGKESSSSPRSVIQIRNLSNNFQKLLAQATKEIKKLTQEKCSLEEENIVLLKANAELAEETAMLIREDNEWRKEREGLMAANDEFVTEVERLYEEEDKWDEEKEKMEVEKKKLEEDNEILEKNKERLTESVKVLTFDNDKLIKEKQEEREQHNEAIKNLVTSHGEISSNLNQELNSLKIDKEDAENKLSEAQKRESEMSEEVLAVSGELDKLVEENEVLMEKVKEADKMMMEKTSLKNRLDMTERRAEKVAAENFEFTVELEKLREELARVKERETRLKVDLDQIKVENKWLINDKKTSVGKEEDKEELKMEVERLRRENREEKEKVTNLNTWKEQLAEKNKQLKEQNNKLLNKAENLEGLMNEEVTDINEILGMINNIQVGGPSSSKTARFLK